MIYPIRLFKGLDSRDLMGKAESEGLMAIEDEDLTSEGLIAKMYEWDESDTYERVEKELAKSGIKMPTDIRKIPPMWTKVPASLNKKAAWVNWRNATGVEVVTGRKPVEKFETLEEAQKVYPMLNPEHNGEEFTWAMKGEDYKGGNRMRFDTWEVNEVLSASLETEAAGSWSKTWKIGEYAIGGIVKATGKKDRVVIQALEWTNPSEVVAEKLFPIAGSMEMGGVDESVFRDIHSWLEEEVTSCYYAGQITDYIKGKVMGKETEATMGAKAKGAGAPFGSVEWQNQKIEEIKEKLDRGEELDQMDIDFMEVQHQHNLRHKLYKLNSVSKKANGWIKE